ncbi:MAG: ScyD/ScyE family protein [Actinomycetota bacterium]|nr:ScyD/ScyE family protein [Actinomycetota bacterium]
MKRLVFATGLVLAVFGGVLPAAAAPTAPTATVVMSGLDNPRGLAFGSNGALYVAESGRGGPAPCQTLRGAVQCYGPSGRISRLWHGVTSHVVTGLPSYITTTGPDTGSATGPHDIAVHGRHGVITIGWGDNPALRNTPPSAVWQQFGHLASVNLKHNRWKLGLDISAYEAAANPDHGAVDSNPYGILKRHGRLLVTDAGGNDLLQVSRGDDNDDEGDNDHQGGNGSSISTVAVFPSRSTTPQHSSCVFPGFPPFTDSVPTSVTVGPDGAYYVGELTGAPFCAGNANVYRVVPGHAPTVYCGGFTTIIDLTFGPDRKLYVAQHSNGPVFFGSPGDVVRVGPGCSKTPVTPPLNRPGSLAFGPNGKLYVSVNANQAGTGQVVRID